MEDTATLPVTDTQAPDEVGLSAERWERPPTPGPADKFGSETADEQFSDERPGETFHRWFGTADLHTVTFFGTLGPSRVEGQQHELHLDGTPLSALLGPEDCAYYARVFLPRLLDGRAVWQGSGSDGRAIEGCIATRRGDAVEILYGEPVRHQEVGRAAPPLESTRSAATRAPLDPTDAPTETIELPLDALITEYTRAHEEVSL